MSISILKVVEIMRVTFTISDMIPVRIVANDDWILSGMGPLFCFSKLVPGNGCFLLDVWWGYSPSPYLPIDVYVLERGTAGPYVIAFVAWFGSDVVVGNLDSALRNAGGLKSLLVSIYFNPSFQYAYALAYTQVNEMYWHHCWRKKPNQLLVRTLLLHS